MKLHFRPIQEAEIPELCRLVDVAYSKQVRKLFGNTSRGRWPHYDESKVAGYRLREPGGVRVGLQEDRILAVNICRSNGSLGWFHSLAVHPDYQGKGLGKQAVWDAQDYFRQQGVRTIALMTWPTALANVGFYQGLGYRAVGLSVHAYRRSHVVLAPGESPFETAFLASLSTRDREAALAAIDALCDEILPGLRYGSWMNWTLDRDMGDVLLFGREEQLAGFALFYHRPKMDWLEGKLLVLAPDVSDEEKLWMFEHIRRWAVDLRRGSFGFSVDVMQPQIVDLLLKHDFRLFNESMLNMISGDLWPPQGTHLVRFSG